MSLWSTTEKPKHLTDAEKAITVGVDAAEAAANNLTAGWVQVQEYTDAQGNARRKSVTLVAMGSIPSDGDTSIVGETTGGGGGTGAYAATLYENQEFESFQVLSTMTTGGAPKVRFVNPNGAFLDALQAGITAGTTFVADLQMHEDVTYTLTTDFVQEVNGWEAEIETFADAMMLSKIVFGDGGVAAAGDVTGTYTAGDDWTGDLYFDAMSNRFYVSGGTWAGDLDTEWVALVGKNITWTFMGTQYTAEVTSTSNSPMSKSISVPMGGDWGSMGMETITSFTISNA